MTFSLVGVVIAQSSSSVTTRIGNPPQTPDSIDATSCPIPNGVISCGSLGVPVNDCGHCGIGYEDWPCNYHSLSYSMDVISPNGTGPLDPIYMPLVNGQVIRWTFSHQTVHSDGITAIQHYGGVNDNTQEQYWIQFHHTQPNSDGGTVFSGDRGANLCQAGCKTGSGPHLHVEFAIVDSSGNRIWQDAPNYFCR